MHAKKIILCVTESSSPLISWDADVIHLDSSMFQCNSRNSRFLQYVLYAQKHTGNLELNIKAVFINFKYNCSIWYGIKVNRRCGGVLRCQHANTASCDNLGLGLF